jgi:hypothetical protein
MQTAKTNVSFRRQTPAYDSLIPLVTGKVARVTTNVAAAMLNSLDLRPA